ncbi:MAG: DUF2807 domain-containing protein [Chryseobacterium sp.]|nr:MAG: DUF2807 domain-containing protein [Chryseobacterium sp.]
MKNIYYLFLFVILASCGDISPKGEITVKDVNVEGFSKIKLDGNFKVFVVRSDSNFVSVETYPNIFDNLKINVKNRQLSISEKRPAPDVDFYNITVYSQKDISDAQLSKKAELNFSSEMKTDDFKLQLTHQAKFIGSVQSTRAEVKMTNSSRANVLGSTGTVKLTTADSASVVAPYWFVGDLNVNQKNNSYAELSVSNKIDGLVTDEAKLVYYGMPQKKVKLEKQAKITQKTNP